MELINGLYWNVHVTSGHMYIEHERPVSSAKPKRPVKCVEPGYDQTNHETSWIILTKLKKNPIHPSIQIIGSIFLPLFSILAPKGNNKNGIIT